MIDDNLESVIEEINSIVNRGDIKEIDFIATEEASPYVIIEGNLGINYSLIKKLFIYSMKNVISLIKKEYFYKQGFAYSTILLIIKGDIQNMYSLRKKWILNGLQTLKAELRFLSAVLSKHPKSPSAWNHRKWCLLESKCNPSLINRQEELKLTEIMSERYPRNYYAWIYRLWIINTLKFDVIEELLYTNHWILSHPSDHTATNHYIQLVQILLKDLNVSQLKSFFFRLSDMFFPHLLLQSILNSSNNFDYWTLCVALLLYFRSESYIFLRPGYEALWYLRRDLHELFIQKLRTTLYIDVYEEVFTIKQGVECCRLDPENYEDSGESQALLFDLLGSLYHGYGETIDNTVITSKILYLLLKQSLRILKEIQSHSSRTSHWSNQSSQVRLAEKFINFIIFRVLSIFREVDTHQTSELMSSTTPSSTLGTLSKESNQESLHQLMQFAYNHDINLFLNPFSYKQTE